MFPTNNAGSVKIAIIWVRFLTNSIHWLLLWQAHELKKPFRSDTKSLSRPPDNISPHTLCLKWISERDNTDPKRKRAEVAVIREKSWRCNMSRNKRGSSPRHKHTFPHRQTSRKIHKSHWTSHRGQYRWGQQAERERDTHKHRHTHAHAHSVQLSLGKYQPQYQISNCSGSLSGGARAT